MIETACAGRRWAGAGPAAAPPQQSRHLPRGRHIYVRAADNDQQPSGAQEEQLPPQPAGADGGTASSKQSTFHRSPWQLMGRMVSEQRIAVQFDDHLTQGLVRSAAARASGLEFEVFEARLQRLLALMPSLQPRLLRIHPALLAALAADPELVAARLIELKSLLPAADVGRVAAHRPSLLLGEWERVPGAVAQLLRHYSQEDVGALVGREPVLLAEDVEQVLDELKRFAPRPQDVARMLLQDPGLLYSVQAGSRSLGPGAEFM